MSEQPAHPAPWTIGEPSTPLAEPWDDSRWHVEISDGNPLSCNRAVVYGPSPEVCRERAETFVRAMTGWRPIEEALRLENILIYIPGARKEVQEAWWRVPYEGAPAEQCAWETMDGICLSADVHHDLNGKPLGATHWQPLPSPPLASEEERR